jgi:GTPase SAR1 family protein
MAETALITIADIQEFRQLDAKFSPARFAAFEQEARRKNLRGLLTDAMYLDFMKADRTQGKYLDLLNGKEYNDGANVVMYYGLKPALCYWWLAIAAREGEAFLSNVGVIQFANNTQQSFETAKEKERLAASYQETAQNYANDVTRFLNANRIVYPLWKGEEEKNSTNFVSFRI